MKTKWTVIFALSLSLLFFAGCTKPGTKYSTPDPNAKQHNEDVNNVKSESDNSNTDVNSALTGTSGFGKKDATNAISICGATIDSSHQHDVIPYLVITFDGTSNCSSRIRSGTIKVELISGAKWVDVGAELRVTYTGYKVIFTDLNNHYVTFNGIKYLTDVSGVDELTYLFTGSVTAKLKERTYNMTVTFENGQTSSWNSARLTTWNVTGYSTIVATVNGDTTIAGKTIDSWGLTRFNTSFQTEMIQPWVSGTACGWWGPTSGKYTSTTDNFSITATLGVNSSGNQVSSGCAYGLKLDWTLSNNSSGEALIPYY